MPSRGWSPSPPAARLPDLFSRTAPPLPQTAAGTPSGRMVSVCEAARWCCDPEPDPADPVPDTTAGPHRSGCAARSAAPTGCRTGIPPAGTLPASPGRWVAGRTGGCTAFPSHDIGRKGPVPPPIFEGSVPGAPGPRWSPCAASVASAPPPIPFYHGFRRWATLSTDRGIGRLTVQRI